MMDNCAKFRLQLLGPFGLFDSSGARVDVSSRKAMALVALLATGRDGVRSRAWLQDMLWGTRGPIQAQGSLRRELSNLRRLVNRDRARPLLKTNNNRIALDMEQLEVDLDQPNLGGPSRRPSGDIFLEGIDIAGEEGFEDWLRGQRAALEAATAKRPTSGPPVLAEVSAVAPPVAKPGQGSEGFFGRPFLAVLRFINLTGDANNEYLAEGLAEDLIEHLSRLRWLPVVSRAASFAHRTDAATLYDIGAALGARYIIEGRLRRRDDGFALMATISDAETGRALWTWRTDLPLGCAPHHLDELLTEIVAALASRVDDAEMNRAVGRVETDPHVNNLIWRARWHHNRYTREDSRIAEDLLQEALARAPNSPEAIVQLADFRQRQVWLNRADTGEIVELRRLAQRAITADYLDGRGYLIAGMAELWLRHTDAAIALFEQAIALNPSLAYAYSQIGAAYYLSGRPEQAIGPLNKALRLNMGEQYAYYVFGELAMSYAMMGRWSDAIEAADQAIVRRPAYWYAHAAKAHALRCRGDLRAATAAYAALLAAKRGFQPDFIDWVPFVEAAWPAELKRTLAAMGEACAGEGARQQSA